jgi:hypothetical protein
MYSDNGNLAMTDATGSTSLIVPNRPWCPSGVKAMGCEVTIVDGGAASSPVLVPDRTLCPTRVRDDNCQASIEEGIAVSPDGSRIGYVLSEGRDLDITHGRHLRPVVRARHQTPVDPQRGFVPMPDECQRGC